jgi:magnesium transporter
MQPNEQAMASTSSPEPPPSALAERQPSGRIRGVAWSAALGAVEVSDFADITRAIGEPGTRVWVDLEDADLHDLEELGRCLGIHPLVVEDIAERNQRAKVEFTDDVMHMVVFALEYRDEIKPVEIDVVLGKDFLLTSHPPEWQPLELGSVERHGPAHFLAKGPDVALYAVLDTIVDGYFPMVDRLSEVTDDLEDLVIQQPDRQVIERLFAVRRNLLLVRKVVTPEREVLNQLTNRENDLIASGTLVYFRDVYDHLVRITDELDTHREMLSSALEAYLSTVNNNLSEIMKRLTAVTAVLAGVGAAAGIFGMSEAFNAGGFWAVVAIVIAVGVATFAYFRKIDWI